MEQAALAASEAQMVAMVIDGREPINEKVCFVLVWFSFFDFIRIVELRGFCSAN